MNTEFFRFKLGDFECVSISDGRLVYPIENFFAKVPKEQVEEGLRQYDLPTDQVVTPYTYLFANTGEQRVLVDMGAGHLAPTTGKLLENMRAAGIEPAEIDTVLITHAHPDHIGGCLDEEGNPIYVNASYYLWKGEWEFWFSESALEKAPESFVRMAREKLQPIQERVNLVEDESEILPGIHAMAAPEHTPGHMVVAFASGKEQLLYIGDTVLHPLHLEHLDWLPIYDILPEKAAASKRRIFDYAADERLWVIGQHFPPFPSLGHIARQGDGWKWMPVSGTIGSGS